MKKIGDKLDLDFEVKVVRAGATSPELVTFASLLQGPTVVSIYMRNNTGSCDKQNDSLVEATAKLSQRGYDIIGVSRDTAGSHQKYATKKGITYTLVSDPDDLFARAVDAIVEKSMYGKTYQGPLRSAWVLDASGTILAIIDKVNAKAHGEQVLAALA